MTRLLRSAFLALSLLLPVSAALAQIQGAPQVPAQPASPPAMQPAPPPAAPANPLPPAASQMGIAPPSAAHPPLQPGDTPASLPVAPAPQAAATLPHDLSPWGMFMAADIVVKAVMIGLAFASLVTWTIWLAKVMELAAAKTGALRSLRRIEAADSLGDAAETISGKDGKLRGAVGALLSAALEETRRSVDLGEDGIKERAAIALSRIEARAGRNMARGTGLLATIGSTAPFVGLFGTVWGIMSSFQSIAASKNTSLAVVAPGIAEALFATAIGLIAAIPATIFYNKFTSEVNRQAQRLEGFADEFSAILSRQIDERA